MQPIKDQAQRTAEREIKRIFKCEVELRDACLNQLNKSISSKINNNLTPKYIGYIDNGHSDKNILVSTKKIIFKIFSDVKYYLL